MNKFLLFLFILFSACGGFSPGYIGQTEKEYRSKNRISAANFVYDTNGTPMHEDTNPKSDGKYIIYVLKNGDSTMVGHLKNGRGLVINTYKKGHRKLLIYYNPKEDTSYAFGKFTDDEDVASYYMLKKGDTTRYLEYLQKREIDWIGYTFVKGICIKIDTNFLRGEVRNL